MHTSYVQFIHNIYYERSTWYNNNINIILYIILLYPHTSWYTWMHKKVRTKCTCVATDRRYPLFEKTAKNYRRRKNLSKILDKEFPLPGHNFSLTFRTRLKLPPMTSPWKELSDGVKGWKSMFWTFRAKHVHFVLTGLYTTLVRA